jgi:hypothetical protein
LLDTGGTHIRHQQKGEQTMCAFPTQKFVKCFVSAIFAIFPTFAKIAANTNDALAILADNGPTDARQWLVNVSLIGE